VIDRRNIGIDVERAKEVRPGDAARTPASGPDTAALTALLDHGIRARARAGSSQQRLPLAP